MESCTDINSKGDGIDGRRFQNVNVQDFKVNLAEKDDHHTAILSKKSTSAREYTMIIPKTDTLGSRFGKCTCGFPKKEGIPCQQMVAVSTLGRIDGLTRTAVMPHWYQQNSGTINFLRILISTHTNTPID